VFPEKNLPPFPPYRECKCSPLRAFFPSVSSPRSHLFFLLSVCLSPCCRGTDLYCLIRFLRLFLSLSFTTFFRQLHRDQFFPPPSPQAFDLAVGPSSSASLSSSQGQPSSARWIFFSQSGKNLSCRGYEDKLFSLSVRIPTLDINRSGFERPSFSPSLPYPWAFSFVCLPPPSFCFFLFSTKNPLFPR